MQTVAASLSSTTVLSSTAAACDHLDHVKTQMPYALLVAALGMVVGDLGTALGLPVWVALLAGVGVLWLVLKIFGTTVRDTPVSESAPGEAPAG